ncbi:MAG: hypothetical protein RBR77_04180 [Thauera sp.]|jgi:hypothetical protein|nr:hypothetical protein [Thauera sp.]
MMVTLSSLTFDPDGYIEIEPLSDTDYGALVRRVNRVATLDGGVAINNFGLTDADRTVRIAFMRTAELDRLTDRLFRLYAFACLVMDDGVYRVALESRILDGAECRLSLLIVERLNVA